jgi:transposase InsO family protein
MTKAEQARLTAWRAKVLQGASEGPRTVPWTCRHFGISRTAFYRWKQRFETHGAAGLGDRPRTPHRSPRATAREVVGKILYLRQQYHFGPGKIADYLKRFHQVSIARSSVHRILSKHGMNQLPANQKHRPNTRRWQRYEKPKPGHRLQMDVKFLERIPGTGKRLYPFTAIDDCTRIRVLKVYDACNQRPAIRFLEEVVRRLPFRIHVVQTDNGAEFQSQFPWHAQALDIQHVYIRPRTPHLNGKVERSHRVDDQEFYQLLDRDGVSDDIHLFNEKLREWEDYYNYHRPADPLRTTPRKDSSWSVTRVLRPYTLGIGSSGWTRTSNPPVNSWGSVARTICYCSILRCRSPRRLTPRARGESQHVVPIRTEGGHTWAQPSSGEATTRLREHSVPRRR